MCLHCVYIGCLVITYNCYNFDALEMRVEYQTSHGPHAALHPKCRVVAVQHKVQQVILETNVIEAVKQYIDTT